MAFEKTKYSYLLFNNLTREKQADAIEITEILQELNDVFKYLIQKLAMIKNK